MSKAQAILLVGPTGSGKTPLGRLLAERGLWGRACFHFDFGETVRRVVAAGESPGLSLDDVALLRSVLESGALLEKEHFYIADALLRGFIARRAVPADGLVVLNGMPRHVEQAEDVDTIVAVRAVVELSCGGKAVFRRIRFNVGGDRTDRCDDGKEAVERKLKIYAARTAPLLDHYRSLGVRIETVEIHAETTAQDVRKALQERPPLEAGEPAQPM